MRAAFCGLDGGSLGKCVKDEVPESELKPIQSCLRDPEKVGALVAQMHRNCEGQQYPWVTVGNGRKKVDLPPPDEGGNDVTPLVEAVCFVASSLDSIDKLPADSCSGVDLEKGRKLFSNEHQGGSDAASKTAGGCTVGIC
eukprot:TRINITY_DN38281_c0_g1_i1.p2 TRINITY_DN38281_c0_g1~~TRINITY_DN38281_c0_g1_i1.p2  ORF type:complete len:140 (-),score=37.13 TRINITY_DN38281_c0_g1_i1:62-481(-)